MRAMILAAGLGTRMRPLTLTTPKPLLDVGGIPLIEHHIRRLASAGISDIVINHAWLGEKIEQTLGSGEKWGVSLHYSPEGEPLETAGGIAHALPLLCPQNDPSPFIVINGDVYCDYDFSLLAAAQESWQDGQLGHLVLVNNPEHNTKGDFFVNFAAQSELSGDNAVDLSAQETVKRLTFSGISLLLPSLFSDIDKGEKAALGPLLRQAIADKKLGAEYYTGVWIDVGTPERLKQAGEAAKHI